MRLPPPTTTTTTTTGMGSALFFALLILAITLTSHAQNISAASQMGFVRAGKYMYVQGGYIQTTPVNRTLTGQVYSLDLSESWSLDSPPWKQLESETPSFLPKLVALPSNQTIYSFGLNYSAQYDVASNTWSSLTPSNPPEPWMFGTVPIIDPTSGYIYLAGYYYMNVYSPQYNSWTNSSIPSDVYPERVFPQGGYNPARKSLIYFGGYYNLTTWCTASYVTEFTIGSKQWNTLSPSGQIPGPRADHCLAFSEDGNTLILWGGRVPIAQGNTVAQQNQPTAEIYLLDFASNTWAKGEDAPIAIMYPSCVVVGDLLVTWGGESTSDIISNIMVFNLTSQKWSSSYTPPEYYVAANSTLSKDTPSQTPSPANIGAIVGGILGGLVIAALSILLIVRYRRQSGGYDAVEKPMAAAAVTEMRGGGGEGADGNGQHYSTMGLSGNIRPVSHNQERLSTLDEMSNYHECQSNGQELRSPQGEQLGWDNEALIQSPRAPQGQYKHIIHQGL